MTLRVLLVGLVVSLGFDWSGGPDLGAWARIGGDWVRFAIASPSEAADGERMGRDATGVDEAMPASVDLAFEVVVDQLANDFAADLAGARGDHPGGLDEPSTLEVAGVVDGPTPEEAGPVSGLPEIEGRADRLCSALRLTLEAVGAWASLVEGPTGEPADGR